MENWKPYRRKGVTYMRPHIVGEDLTGISVSEPDKEAVKYPGGFIARDPDNPADQWYINKQWFDKNFEQ